MHTDTPHFDVLLPSGQTDDAVGITEIIVPAGWGGPPLHHHDFDETFYVLDGELTFQVGETLRTAGRGSLIFARRGQHHTLANLSRATARYLNVCIPGAFTSYFLKLAAEASGTTPPPEASKPYPETIIVGPTIAERLARAA